MAGQQRARDGHDCLLAPGMGGLGRKVEALFWHFLCIASHGEVNTAIVGIIITTTVKISEKWEIISTDHAFRRSMRSNALYIGQYKDLSGIAEFSRNEQTINKWNYATAAILIIVPCVDLKQKEYLADCVKIVGSAQLALLGLRHVYEKGDVGVPLLVVSLLVWAGLVLLGIGLLRNDDGGQ